MSGEQRALLVGLAGELHTAGVSVYNPVGVVVDPATGTYFGETPAAPDRAVTLAAYFTDDQLEIAFSTLRVNVNLRGKPGDTLDVDDLSDAVFDVLHNLKDRAYGPVRLVQMFRLNSMPLGSDGNDRSERSDNYQVDLDMPVTARRPW